MKDLFSRKKEDKKSKNKNKKKQADWKWDMRVVPRRISGQTVDSQGCDGAFLE
jgi:hypothetical protein